MKHIQIQEGHIVIKFQVMNGVILKAVVYFAILAGGVRQDGFRESGGFFFEAEIQAKVLLVFGLQL